jgi:hypothetical protein
MANLVKSKHNAGGERTRWDKEAVRDDLRARFMREIETAAPEVLLSLRNEVWPLYQKIARPGEKTMSGNMRPASWPEELRTAVREFGLRHNLVYSGRVPHWVEEQCSVTLDVWTRHPDVMRGEKLGWCVRSGYSGLRKADLLGIKLPPMIERSIYETDAEFETRVFVTLRKIVRPQLEALSIRIGLLPVVPRKRRAEHYTWAVLHQIHRRGFEDIAREFHVAMESVKNKVTDFKRQIGLNLPPGRPRKKRIH